MEPEGRWTRERDYDAGVGVVSEGAEDFWQAEGVENRKAERRTAQNAVLFSSIGFDGINAEEPQHSDGIGSRDWWDFVVLFSHSGDIIAQTQVGGQGGIPKFFKSFLPRKTRRERFGERFVYLKEK